MSKLMIKNKLVYMNFYLMNKLSLNFTIMSTFSQTDNLFLIPVEWIYYFQKICKIEDMFKQIN